MELKICKRCVMNGSASELVIDADGICNFCHQAQKALQEIESQKYKLPEIIRRIKEDGRGKKYDCLVGLSGGADSSTVLYHLLKLRLRPLCFTIDNGYNDSRADENIMRLVEGLKVPFYRYTIDLKIFRDLQAAFMKAGQINIEVPTDHILMASSLEMAAKEGIKWIISGGNVKTESVMPQSWGRNARDLPYLKDVYRKEFKRELKGLPMCGLLKWNYYKWIRGIRTFYLLDYLDYNWLESKKMLAEKYGWKDYGAKHEESAWTKWFQSFWLYEKFGIDKRLAHLSSLINSGQLQRSEALEQLKEAPEYPRLGLEKRAMSYPKIRDTDFKSDEWLYKIIGKFVRLWKS